MKDILFWTVIFRLAFILQYKKFYNSRIMFYGWQLTMKREKREWDMEDGSGIEDRVQLFQSDFIPIFGDVEYLLWTFWRGKFYCLIKTLIVNDDVLTVIIRNKTFEIIIESCERQEVVSDLTFILGPGLVFRLCFVD